MSAKTWVQDVVPGYAEYLTQTFTVNAANDYVEFEFSKAINIEELIVESTGTVSETYDLSIVYPNAEKQMVIVSGESADLNYYLNSDEKARAWYRIPARGKLRATCSTYSSSFTLSIFVIGRM